MTGLEQQITDAVRQGRWSLSNHADERLQERGAEPWQIAAGFDEGRTSGVEPAARPNPKILRRQMLPDGQEIIVVWAYEQM